MAEPALMTPASRPASQVSTHTCDCGHRVPVTPLAGGYEFEWRCLTCQQAGVISWAHAEPPPVFTPATTQLTLFSEATA